MITHQNQLSRRKLSLNAHTYTGTGIWSHNATQTTPTNFDHCTGLPKQNLFKQLLLRIEATKKSTQHGAQQNKVSGPLPNFFMFNLHHLDWKSVTWVGRCISCMNLVLSGELHSYKKWRYNGDYHFVGIDEEFFVAKHKLKQNSLLRVEEKTHHVCACA